MAGGQCFQVQLVEYLFLSFSQVLRILPEQVERAFQVFLGLRVAGPTFQSSYLVHGLAHECVHVERIIGNDRVSKVLRDAFPVRRTEVHRDLGNRVRMPVVSRKGCNKIAEGPVVLAFGSKENLPTNTVK